MAVSRLRRTLLMVACTIAGTAAWAQSFPDRPITWIVPYAAGGGTDFMTRTVAEQMSKSLGQAVVVENRAGAAGGIGLVAAARAKPDGYTLVTGENGALTINPNFYKKLAYDPVKDLVPIGMFAKIPFLLIVDPARLKVNTLQEFVSYAKAHPHKLSYGSFGPGSIAHLMGEMFKVRAKIDMLAVPYKGAAPAIQDFLGGQIDAIFVDYAVAKAFIDQGRMKALAVTTRERSFALPEVPTFQESGVPDYDVASWMGLMAPAGTTAGAIERLTKALSAALEASELKATFAGRGILIDAANATEFSDRINKDLAKWSAVVRDAKIERE